MLHCLEHLYADSGFHLGGVFFLILRFFCLQHLARDDYCIGGFSFAVLNRFCNPTTDLLITITILIFIFILIFTILIILIIPSILSILIILIILFVLIIVVINSFLLPSLSSSSVSFIVLVSNLINIKISALFVTCSNSKNPRETVAAFRLHLANPPLRLPPYPSPASFRTSPLASSSGWYSMILQRNPTIFPPNQVNGTSLHRGAKKKHVPIGRPTAQFLTPPGGNSDGLMEAPPV